MTLLSKSMICLVLGAGLVLPYYAEAKEFKGMSYVGWGVGNLNTAQSDDSIADMKELGVDTVAVNVFWFQSTPQSHEIYPDYQAYSTTMEGLEHAIQEIHGNGMAIILKPNLDIQNREPEEWRAMIQPHDPEAWFASYTEYILTMAALAEKNNVEILSIGTELNGVEKYDKEWRQLINRVRGVYSGKLIYAANYAPVGRIGGGYQAVEFWNELDYIGIDAYYQLSYKLEPSMAEMVRAWQKVREEIALWRQKKGLKQQVIFTEVGYRSVNRSVTYPWDYSTDGVLDLQEQAEAYESLLIAFTDQGWWGGAMWWYWSADPLEGGKYDRGFSPKGKPAGEILKRYYAETLTLKDEASVTGKGSGLNNLGLLALLVGGKYVAGISGLEKRLGI